MICLRSIAAVFLLTLAITTSSFAIAGVGFHWGTDLTLSMEDKEKEWLNFSNLTIDTSGLKLGNFPAGLSQIAGKDLPIYLTRTDWERTNFNLGGKVYIDVIPMLDAIELSGNFGIWQYQGSISYPVSMSLKSSSVDYKKVTNPEDLFTTIYRKVPLTLKEYDINYFGLDGTPYVKLGLDLTARKYFLKLPPVVNVLRIYGGGGLTINFATPMLHRSIIEKALGKTLDDAFSLNALNADLFSNEELMKEVLNQIIDDMMTPHYGCHLDLGVMVKIPIVPIGFYVDGKFMMPFGKMDDNVDIGGFGLLINTGISLSF